MMLEFSREVSAGRLAAECELERRTQILAAQLRAAEITIAAERAERMRVEDQLFFTPPAKTERFDMSPKLGAPSVDPLDAAVTTPVSPPQWLVKDHMGVTPRDSCDGMVDRENAVAS